MTASIIKSQHDTVHVVTRLQDAWQRNHGWIPSRDNTIFSYPKCPDLHKFPTRLLPNGYQTLFPWGKND